MRKLIAILLLLFTTNAYGDGNDNYTVSLLHLNGTDGSTTITDDAAGGTHTWSTFATAQIDTDIADAFGGTSGSLILDGDSDYINSVNSSDWNFGTGNFTVDFWVRRNGDTFIGGLVGSAWSSPLKGWSVRCGYGGTVNKVAFDIAEIGNEIVSSSVLANLTWTHVAVVRNGNVLTMYLDGVSVGTKDCTGRTYDSGDNGVKCGRYYGDVDNYYFNGHLDEVRISKGIARWTAPFTPPSEPYSVLFPPGVVINNARIKNAKLGY